MIEPDPPRADLTLPWDAIPGPGEHVDVVAQLGEARAALGDTFAVRSGGVEHLFVFAPESLRAFYALDERDASKGIADWQLLRRKVPDELFRGRRTLPHELFGRHATLHYLEQLRAAIDVEFAELGTRGELDVFAWSRRLGHRMGLACWAGETPSAGPRFERLVGALDQLDAADAFVRPADMPAVARSGKTVELAALGELETLLAESVARRDGDVHPGADLFGDIIGRWTGVSEPERTTGIARDAVLVHLGSMSNLFAALGWTIVHVLQHPHVLGRLLDGERGLAEQCALESIRLAQRSIMMRAVLRPIEIPHAARRYRLAPGTTVATMLALTNCSAAPGLAGYDPDRWQRRRLRADRVLAAREQVTTFGHGAHTCPAQPFSLAALTEVVSCLVARFELAADFALVRPLPGQIGGVARAAGPCVVGYRARGEAVEVPQ
jgi:cytochrome P450